MWKRRAPDPGEPKVNYAISKIVEKMFEKKKHNTQIS